MVDNNPMSETRAPLAVHLAGAALLCAIVAYAALRLWQPVAPVIAAPVAAGAAPAGDPRLAARMFGDVGASTASVIAVQVGGVLSARRDASAVLSVDGRPARAFLVGQEVAPGTVLAAIDGQAVTLERAGARTRYPVPPLAQSQPGAQSAPRPGAAAAPPPAAAPASPPPAAGLPLGAVRAMPQRPLPAPPGANPQQAP
jgi:general secretion pathway protein C